VRFLFYSILVFFSLLLVCCSEKENYKVLTFFFDGVPDPNAKIETKNKTNKIDSSKIKRRMNIVKQAELKVFFHEPFKERLCNECHDFEGGNKLIKPLPDLCFSCHDDFFEEKQFKHGPAVSGNCTMCHHPHFTDQEFMMKRKGREVCLYCHDENNIMVKPIHKENGSKLCWTCHDPHAADKRYLLK